MSRMRDPQTNRGGSAIAVAQLSVDGEWLSAEPGVSDLLGCTFEMFSRRPFDQLFPARDRDEDQELRAKLVRGEIPYYYSQRSVADQDGEPQPVRVVFSLLSHLTDPRSGCILAVIEDVGALQRAEAALEESDTARHELARRLTTAQERERTRIARELHDDIGQSLAILRIQMLRAGQPVSGMIGKRHPTVADLCDNLKMLTEKVSRLSHQLHSSELEYLGLAAAIQSHCREFSEKYKIAMDCSCNDVPENLDSLLALSLLRIVQEALHNAAKHSQAKSIQVAIQGTPSELSLLISDDGVGFDPEEAKLAAGLGLISMRERIHLAGGDFRITTQPGEGTCISARVPLIENQEGVPVATAEQE